MTKFSTLSAKFSTPRVLIPRTGPRKIPRLRRQIARIWWGGEYPHPLVYLPTSKYLEKMCAHNIPDHARVVLTVRA